MLPGLNAARPRREQYERFLTHMTSYLESLELKDLSFMLYGSYVGGRLNPGKSDIDAVIMVPGDVITNKGLLRSIGDTLASAKCMNPITFQVNVCDWALWEDGRFSPYLANFDEYFRVEGDVVLGRDPRPRLTREEKRNGICISMSYNLRKARTGIIEAQYHLISDREKFRRRFESTLDGSLRAAGQILRLRDPTLLIDKSAAAYIQDIYPCLDITVLDKTLWLFKDLSRLDAVYERPGEMIELMEESTTCFEAMIKAYREEYPV